MAYKSLSCGDGAKSDVRTELDGFMTMDGLYQTRKGRAGGLARKTGGVGRNSRLVYLGIFTS